MMLHVMLVDNVLCNTLHNKELYSDYLTPELLNQSIIIFEIFFFF